MARKVLGLGSILLVGSLIQVTQAETGTTNILSGVNTNAGATFIVGNTGPFNYFEINSAGSVSNGVGIIGSQAGASNNTVLVTGGSVWTNMSDLTIGSNGAANQLIITNGSVVRSASGTLGYVTGDGNQVVVTGPNSAWYNTTFLALGRTGSTSKNNQLSILDGAHVSSVDGYVGFETGETNNIVLVSGPGSTWTNGGLLRVGSKGSYNQMIVSNGAQVINVTGDIGIGAGANSNLVTVTGAGSLWKSSGALTVGANGIGNRLLVENGGVVEANTLTAGTPAGNSISNIGGVYQFTVFNPSITPNGAGRISITNGTISFRGVPNVFFAPLSGLAYGGNNTLQLDNSTNASAPSYAFDSVANTGSPSNYQRLALANGSRWQTSTLMIGSGGELIGSGTVAANTTNAGVIAPGFSAAGSLTFTSNLVFGTSSQLQMEIGGTNTFDYDQLIVGGSVTVTGTLAVTTLNGFLPTLGQSFTLIDNQGPDPIAGLFNGLTNNAVLDASANGFHAYYIVQYNAGVGGNDLVLIATIPEPSALGMMILAAGALLWRRRP